MAGPILPVRSDIAVFVRCNVIYRHGEMGYIVTLVVLSSLSDVWQALSLVILLRLYCYEIVKRVLLLSMLL